MEGTMEAQQIKAMLDEEIVASGEFTKRNFGLQVGDGYPEIVREIVKSNRVTGHLMVMLLGAALGGRGVSEDLSRLRAQGGENLDMSRTILDNIEVFTAPLEFFYWGMQVGRKLERQEAAMLQNMEGEAQKGGI
jgi:hypothetical protein